MRVLLVAPEYPPETGGGILRYLRDMATSLAAQGCEVSVIKGSALANGLAPYSHEGITVKILDRERFVRWSQHFAHLAMYPTLRGQLATAFAIHEQANEDGSFDVVEVTDYGMLFLPWVLRSQVPVLVQMHGSSGQLAIREPALGREAEGIFTHVLERTALAGGCNLSTYSRSNAGWWQSTLMYPVHYAPPPLRLPDRPAKPAERNDHWVTVGRIQHWKGPQVACAAWSEMGSEAPTLRWIGGDTSLGGSRLSTSSWLESGFPSVWKHRVVPRGTRSLEDVFTEVSAAKAVLIPSLWDTFNLAAAEAMALEKVVVVSDGAGVAELIQHSVSGFVFPNGDAKALAQIVREVQSLSVDRATEIGRRAASVVRTVLDPSKVAVARMALYKGLGSPKREDLKWLEDFLFKPTTSSPLAFLDELPLSALTKYVFRRAKMKLLRRSHRS